jgi:aspartate/methionine/tyrosine aminotransferase
MASVTAAMELRGGVVDKLQARQRRLLAAFDAAVERFPAVADAVFAHVAQGAFYWFPNVEGVLEACRAAIPKGGVPSAATGKPISSDSDLANHLLLKANVVALPGSEFGAAGYLRLAYCVPMETIDAGIAAMIGELAELLEQAQGLA